MYGDWGALYGRGRVGVDEVEEVVGGDVGAAARKEDGENAVFADSFVQRGDEVAFGDGALLEKFFHQLVLAFSDELDKGLMGGLGLGGEVGGHFAAVAVAVAVRRVKVGSHGHEIDDSVEALGVGDGELDGGAGAAPALVKIVDKRGEAAAAAGFWVVH